MEDLRFEITRISSDRRLDGNTRIDAVEMEKGIKIVITVTSKLVTKEYVKEQLIKEYSKFYDKPVNFKVGDIL